MKERSVSCDASNQGSKEASFNEIKSARCGMGTYK